MLGRQLDVGARLSEMLKLRECNGAEVVFKGAVTVEDPTVQTGRRRSKKNTKSGKSRRVPLISILATADEPRRNANTMPYTAAKLRRAVHGRISLFEAFQSG